MPHFELPFFTNLLILLVGAKILGEMFERIGQPSMIGEIIAGIILGPSIFNLIHRTEDIKVISELGVFLLVIMAGLEIRIDDILKSLKGRNIFISILAFFVPLGTGLGVGFAFNQPLMTSVFIALCIAITALPVSIRILMDLGKINSEVGQRIISVAIFDDILALTILGVLITIKDTDLTFLPVVKAASWSLIKLIIFLVLLSFAYFGIQRITRKGDLFEQGLNKLLSILKGKEPLFALFFAFILTFSMVTESLGLHFIVGAFFASMLITESFIGKDNLRTVEKTTTNMAMGFLAPIFFAGIGLEFSISSISNYGLLLAILTVSYSTKILAGFIGGKIARMSNWSAITLGIGLNARGIMELVIANIAYKAKIINVEIFSMLVIMGVLTTLTTPIALKYTFKKIKG
jgi:Kef-type K+ transport system membrane component KefB